MRKIKKEDDVLVIAGRDKGKRGEVLRVLDGGKLLVSGANLVKKHQRPNPQLNQQGGILDREAPIDVSNVAIFNEDTGKADRIGVRVEDGSRVRFFKSDGRLIDD